MLTLFIAVGAGVAAFTIGKPLLVGDTPPPWAQTQPVEQQGPAAAPPANLPPQLERLMDQAADLRTITAQAGLHRQLNGTFVGAPVPADVTVLAADTDNFVIARFGDQCEVGGVVGLSARHVAVDPSGAACSDAAAAVSLLAR